MTEQISPQFGSIGAACAMIGGDKPISPATYYRGVKRGIYPAPFKVGPNVSRVNLDRLATVLREMAGEPEAA